jgi:hypothetical protein
VSKLGDQRNVVSLVLTMDSLVGSRAGREGESSTSKTRPLRGDTIIKMAFSGSERQKWKVVLYNLVFCQNG